MYLREIFTENMPIDSKIKLFAEKGESSFISLENDFYNNAGIIMENGSDRASNEPFDDDPQKGAKEAEAAMEMMMNASSLVAANEASIPLSGEALETRDDIPEFDKNCQYPDGTIVKKQMDDGTYVLGKASSPNNKKVSVFEAYDKDAVAEHTSLKGELKSYGKGIWGGINKFSTGCRDSMNWFGEHVLRLNFDKPNSEGGKSYREIAQEDDARDEVSYNELREKAPCKSQFDDASNASETTLNVASLVMGVYGAKQAVKSGISYLKANEPYIKAMSSEFKNDAAMLKQAVKNVNKKPSGMIFGSNGGNASKYVSDVKEEFNELKNLKPGVKATNQSESSVPGDIDDLIKASEGGNKASETTVSKADTSKNNLSLDKNNTNMSNEYSLSGEEHYSDLKDVFGDENVKWETENSQGITIYTKANNDLQKYRTDIIDKYGEENLGAKVNIAIDIENPSNYEMATSSSYVYNPTILTEGEKFNYELFNDKFGGNYEKYYNYLLTEEYLNEIPDSYFRNKNLNREEVKIELKKFRDAIERTKHEAKAKLGENAINDYGNLSFIPGWNVENCAEIWSTRKAIMNGAKFEDIQLRCVETDTGNYAPQCKNCKHTFKDHKVIKDKDLIYKQ